jgi:hypothetical protein
MIGQERYRMTKFGFHATEQETDQKLKETLTPDEYQLIKRGARNDDEISKTVDLLVKAGLVEETK